MRNTKKGTTTSLIPISHIEDEYLVTSDGRPVFVWEVNEGINLFNINKTEIDSILSNYSRLFGSLGEDDILQIIASYRPLNPNYVYENYLKQAASNSGLLKDKFLPTQKNWLFNLAESSKTGQIRYYLLYTIKHPVKNDLAVLIPEITNKSLGILGYLSRLSLYARALNKVEIKDLLDREINPFLPKLSDKAFKRAAPGTSGGDGFATQKEVIARDAVIPHKDHLEFGCGGFSRTLYLEALPFENTNAFFRHVFTQCGYFRLSLFAYGIDQQFAYSKLEKQFIQSGQKQYMDNNYDAKSSALEGRSKELIDRFAEGSILFNRFSFYMTLYADTKTELDNHTAAFEGICADYPLIKGYREQDILYKSSLPCGNDTAFKRYLTTSEGLANAFPFISARVGMKNGAVIGFDALGEPVYFNQWARDEIENPVHVILGQMGSGKSFLQEIIEARQAPYDVVTCIFHKSNNYDFSTRLLGGQVLDFDLESKTKLNIFDPADPKELEDGPNPDTVAVIMGFLNIILTDTGTAGIGTKEEAVLEAAIRGTYISKQGNVPMLEDLAEELTKMGKNTDYAEHKQLVKDLRLKLDPYIGKGSYAELTNRQSTVNITSSRVVLNMSKIPENNPKVFALSMFVASSILGKILNVNKGRKFVKVKFDETWAFLKSPSGAGLIDNLVRRARHLNIALDIVTQFPSDLLATDSARSVLQGAKCITLLQQSPTDFQVLKEVFGLSDSELEIVGHLGQVKGVYSQAYMITGKRRGLVNIMPDPYSYWIATSEPTHDLPRRDEMIKKHTINGRTDYWKVVDELVKTE